VVQVAQLFDIRHHLVDRLHDGVDVGAGAEEDLLRKPSSRYAAFSDSGQVYTAIHRGKMILDPA
jgi:hypothetical protein